MAVAVSPVLHRAGRDTVRSPGDGQPNSHGKTYASQVWPDVLLRPRFAP
ncbi:hypothetical protein [Sphingomonas phyllosphaerae]|nr:hypothetical protein [Sphingomonas phyllosphaerae]